MFRARDVGSRGKGVSFPWFGEGRTGDGVVARDSVVVVLLEIRCVELVYEVILVSVNLEERWRAYDCDVRI